MNIQKARKKPEIASEAFLVVAAAGGVDLSGIATFEEAMEYAIAVITDRRMNAGSQLKAIRAALEEWAAHGDAGDQQSLHFDEATEHGVGNGAA